MTTQKDIIKFVEDSIIHRFRILETIKTSQGMIFTGEQFSRFLKSRQIKPLHSSLYYAQANREAKAANKVIINMMKRYIGRYPRKLIEKLSKVLWV